MEFDKNVGCNWFGCEEMAMDTKSITQEAKTDEKSRDKKMALDKAPAKVVVMANL